MFKDNTLQVSEPSLPGCIILKALQCQAPKFSGLTARHQNICILWQGLITLTHRKIPTACTRGVTVWMNPKTTNSLVHTAIYFCSHLLTTNLGETDRLWESENSTIPEILLLRMFSEGIFPYIYHILYKQKKFRIFSSSFFLLRFFFFFLNPSGIWNPWTANAVVETKLTCSFWLSVLLQLHSNTKCLFPQ